MASLALNNYFSKSSQKVFYSWLEPYGIGGHTLFINYSLNQKVVSIVFIQIQTLKIGVQIELLW